MQLSRAVSYPGGCVDCDAEVVLRELRRCLFCELHQIGGWRAPRFGKRHGGAVFVIAGKFFESQRPTVSLVRHKTLKHRQRIRLAIRRNILDRTGKRRNAVESFLRQVFSNFAIRIRSRLLPAEEFQDQAVAVDHGGITLLRGAALCSQDRVFGTTQRSKLRARHSPNQSISRLSLLPALDETEEGGAGVLIAGGVVQVSWAALGDRLGKDGVCVFLPQLFRIFAKGSSAGEKVGFRVSF